MNVYHRLATVGVPLGTLPRGETICAHAARRQRERQRMSELLAKAQEETDRAVSTEPVFDILRSVYPDAIVRLRPSRTSHIAFEEGNSIPVSDIKGGVWDNVEYLDDFIMNANHLPAPSDRTAGILSAVCESTAGSSLLLVATKDFHFVFDDADAWFVPVLRRCSFSYVAHSFTSRGNDRQGEVSPGIFSPTTNSNLWHSGCSRPASRRVQVAQTEYRKFSQSAIEQSTSHLETKIKSRDPTTFLNIIKIAGRDLTSIINNLIALNNWSNIAMAERHYAMHTLDELETEIGHEVAKIIMGGTIYNCSIAFTQTVSDDYSRFWTDMRVLRDNILPLVINAIQCTPQGIISVNVSISPDVRQLVVDVKDTGKGISLDDHRRILSLMRRLKLDALPSQFYEVTANSGSLSLGNYFTSFLTRN